MDDNIYIPYRFRKEITKYIFYKKLNMDVECEAKSLFLICKDLDVSLPEILIEMRKERDDGRWGF